MPIFITGTDTDVGKTVISAWLCTQTKACYWKPIQTGSIDANDSLYIQELTNAKVIPSIYNYKAFVAPYLAAKLENATIELDKINLPKESNLIIEGAGGLLVPINKENYITDVIKKLSVPTILVARTTLGTINHTLLSITALRASAIKILGVIMNGKLNQENKEAIEYYGKIKVLAEFNQYGNITPALLDNIKLPLLLKQELLLNGIL